MLRPKSLTIRRHTTWFFIRSQFSPLKFFIRFLNFHKSHFTNQFPKIRVFSRPSGDQAGGDEQIIIDSKGAKESWKRKSI